MANKIQVRRGLKAALPTLSVGEFGLCTDAKELYIGTASGNIRVDASSADLSDVAPKSHASTTTDYGEATTSTYGHTKLSASINSTSTDLAATPSAVKEAYDLANAALPASSVTISSTDVTPGTSALTDNTLYFFYE